VRDGAAEETVTEGSAQIFGGRKLVTDPLSPKKREKEKWEGGCGNWFEREKAGGGHSS